MANGLPEAAKERYFHRRSADNTFTTLNIPKLVADIGLRIDRLKVVRNRLDEAINGTLPPNQQLQRVQQGMDILEVQLNRLEQMFELLEYSLGPDES